MIKIETVASGTCPGLGWEDIVMWVEPEEVPPAWDEVHQGFCTRPLQPGDVFVHEKRWGGSNGGRTTVRAGLILGNARTREEAEALLLLEENKTELTDLRVRPWME
jgi:hypothetical protein